MLTVTKIEKDAWDLIVYFDDSSVKKVDIRSYLKGYSQSEAIKIRTDMDYFHKALNEGAAISWPNGFAIDPDYIHIEGEEIIPKKKIASMIKAFKRIIDKDEA